MRRYCGVLALHQGQVALVREQYETWDTEYWNVPSGAVEVGESPTAGAVRELREETGLRAADEALGLVWTTTVIHQGRAISASCNYVASIAEPTFCVDDPDGSVIDVQWFRFEEALRRLRSLPYPPLRVPAVAYLERPTPQPVAWTFTLSEAANGEPLWSWQSSVSSPDDDKPLATPTPST
jgi:8-oxo-dGTP diphosphatase